MKFLILKSVGEIFFAAILLLVWSYMSISQMVDFQADFLSALLAVLAGFLSTGYIFCIAVLFIFLYFSKLDVRINLLLICAVPILYVLIFYIGSPKNELTTPVASGVIAINLIALSFVRRVPR